MEVKPERNEYIICIFKQMEAKKDVTNKIISEKLGVSPSSVTEMLRKLRDDGTISIGKRISLTDKGEDYAKNIISKHRLWEYFMTKELGYKWEDVHEQCQLLQNVTGEVLFNKLNEYLSYPKFCPHGGYIYSNVSDAKIQIKLSESIVGKSYKIVSIVDDKSLLKYADSIGLYLSQTITVEEFSDFDKSCLIQTQEGDKINISPKATTEIYLMEIE